MLQGAWIHTEIEQDERALQAAFAAQFSGQIFEGRDYHPLKTHNFGAP